MKILGINLAEHGSICMLNDGQIEFYLEVERITRKKYDFQVHKIFDMVSKPDAIALADCDYGIGREGNDKPLYTSIAKAKISRMYPDVPVHDFTNCHHLTHASVGYYTSHFLEAVCIVVDGLGSNKEVESIYHVSHNEFLRVQKRLLEPESQGFGRLFELTAIEHGWDHREAGKVMGLAAYGKGNSYEIQTLWETRLKLLADDAIRLTGCNNIVLSGGCMLNCVANYKLRKSLPKHVKLYTVPVAHDGGTSIGAAYLVHYDTKIRNP